MSRQSRAVIEQQFDRLMSDYHGALNRLAASYTHSAADRDDLLQEIGLALWRALPGFRGDCSERTFLFRIAHNRCITHLSRRREVLSLDDMQTEPEDPAATTEAQISGAQQRRQLLAAIRGLPMIYREVIVLALEGMEYREIAGVVGISEANVGARLTRARQQLKKQLENQR